MSDASTAVRALALAAGAALLAACGDRTTSGWSGYAEGDYVYVAAPLAGRLDTLAVQAGQNVVRGAALFTLDDEAERAARDWVAAEGGGRVVATDGQPGRLLKGSLFERMPEARWVLVVWGLSFLDGLLESVVPFVDPWIAWVARRVFATPGAPCFGRPGSVRRRSIG